MNEGGRRAAFTGGEEMGEDGETCMAEAGECKAKRARIAAASWEEMEKWSRK